MKTKIMSEQVAAYNEDIQNLFSLVLSKDEKRGKMNYALVNALANAESPLILNELCEIAQVSIPTGTKLVQNLVEMNLINEAGKRETGNGRRPSQFVFNSSMAYVVGVDVQLNSISLEIMDLKLNSIYFKRDGGFQMNKSVEDIRYLDAFIRDCLEESGLDQERLLGLGLGVTGRVDVLRGASINYLNEMQQPIEQHLKELLDIPVSVENDSRVVGYYEHMEGCARGDSNALVVNLSRGLGLSIIQGGELLSGNHGFAGEFGHMQFGGSSQQCLCGKIGCLGTIVGGDALEKQFYQAIEKGKSSLLKGQENLHYTDIINGALEGDLLSIELLHAMGVVLGKAIGNLVNLLAPEKIVIGGKFSRAHEMISNGIQSGMRQVALISPLEHCQLVFAPDSEHIGTRGAGTLILRKLKLN